MRPEYVKEGMRVETRITREKATVVGEPRGEGQAVIYVDGEGYPDDRLMFEWPYYLQLEPQGPDLHDLKEGVHSFEMRDRIEKACRRGVEWGREFEREE